jgi:hypothetical protein
MQTRKQARHRRRKMQKRKRKRLRNKKMRSKSLLSNNKKFNNKSQPQKSENHQVEKVVFSFEKLLKSDGCVIILELCLWLRYISKYSQKLTFSLLTLLLS